MGDHADDLALQEAGLDRVPDGTFYVYRHKGKKYSFTSIKQANEWARKKGFSLTDKKPKDQRQKNG